MGTLAALSKRSAARSVSRVKVLVYPLLLICLASVFISPCRVSNLPIVENAELLRKEGKLAEAEAAVLPLLNDGELRVRARAIGVVARIRLKQGRSTEAIDGLKRSAEMNVQAGDLDNALRDEFALAYTLISDGRNFSSAREALGRAERITQRVPSGLSGLRYYQGLLASETGDYRTALTLYRESFEKSRNDADGSYRLSSLLKLSETFRTLGRAEESEELIREALAVVELADPCTQTALWINVAWFRMSDNGSSTEAGDLLAKALNLLDTQCPDSPFRAHVLTDQAYISLGAGQVVEAEKKLESARKLALEPEVSLVASWLDLTGQIALRRGNVLPALDTFKRLRQIAVSGLLPTFEWRAALGSAQSLQRLERVDEAAAAYEEAETILTRSALKVPGDQGRVGFLVRFAESSDEAIRFFIDRRPALAAQFARRARARALELVRWGDRVAALRGDERKKWEEAVTTYQLGRANLEVSAGDLWKLTGVELEQTTSVRREQQARLEAELDTAISQILNTTHTRETSFSTPGPSELFLVYHPVGNRYAAFALTASNTAAFWLEPFSTDVSDAELGRKLFTKLEAWIENARKIKLIVSGSLVSRDLHTLIWNDAPLWVDKHIVYTTDVGQSKLDSPRSHDTALVVGNPSTDLPSSESEAREIASLLRNSGFRVIELQREAATYEAVISALRSVRLFHYAGHGERGTASGWDGRMALANGATLSIGDVLARHHVPEVVFLSGCETEGNAHAGTAQELGLAQAFVVAGSRAVIASPRLVNDSLAERIAKAVYTDLVPGEALADNVAARLRNAALTERTANPGTDWATFRVVVP
ncbi:MAG: CHAT domain-containing protein [Polyangiaceae bacterium]|nr:CHAT domain-containing protein [Polyangiaceae bacterium]